MKKYLDLAMDIGEQMLICGAEVHRVEDSVYRICNAFGASRVDVFIITSSMVVTLHDSNGLPYTQTRRITNVGSNFDRLSRLNALSRKICSSKNLSVEDIGRELTNIISSKYYPFWMECVFYSLIAWSFALFFGGDLIQSFVSAFIGVCVRFTILFSDVFLNNRIFSKFISSLVITALAFLALELNFITTVDYVIIGNIMVLIPGIGLTNSLRDLFIGDSMSGVLRLIEALLSALAIALGYVVFILLLGTSVETTSEVAFSGLTYGVIQVITGLLGSLGFGVLFNVRGKHLLAVSLGGGFAWALYLGLYALTKNETLCYFVVSVGVSLYAEIMARVLKSPTTVFITPSLIPLIPGASLYYTMTSMFGGDLILFLQKAIVTVQLASALALGVIVSTAIMKIIYKLILTKKVNK